MRHGTVFKERETYAGWPANHGAWQWGDEFLLGFMLGTFDREGIGNGIHPIKYPYTKMLARSMDGGETWSPYFPGLDFTGISPVPPPEFDLNDPNTIIRVCGNYDTGGEDCHQLGGFYLSRDKGDTWRGPFHFDGLDAVFGGMRHNTSRTRVIGNEVYLSTARKDQWGTDWTFVARHDGRRFVFDANTDVVWMDKYRAVMPAVAKIGEATVVALRRKGMGRNWIDIVRQDEPGAPWQLLAQPNELAGVAETGAYNGNPPALARFGDRLVCAYANRSVKSMQFVWSDDKGKTWSDPFEFDRGQNSDIGYPQLFVRNDGWGVCAYYWSLYSGHTPFVKTCFFDPAQLQPSFGLGKPA